MSSRERTHSRVLLAVGAALYLQGCGATGAYPPLQRIESSSKPRSGACLTPEEENLLEEACCALDAGEPAALSSRFPTSRSALVLEELLRRQMARRRAEPELRPQPRIEPPPSAPRDEPGSRRAFLEARVLVEKGKLKEACDRLEDAVALDPGNEEHRAELVAAYKQLGLELYGKGDYRRASVYWTRALEIRPDDEEAQRFLRRANQVIENR
jgi:tetratricopeptide (TPR) repeat protein